MLFQINILFKVMKIKIMNITMIYQLKINFFIIQF